jgi:hypothetical protein
LCRFDEAIVRRRRKPRRGMSCPPASYLPLASVQHPSTCYHGLSSFALQCSTVGVIMTSPAQYSGSGTLHIPYMLLDYFRRRKQSNNDILW